MLEVAAFPNAKLTAFPDHTKVTGDPHFDPSTALVATVREEFEKLGDKVDANAEFQIDNDANLIPDELCDKLSSFLDYVVKQTELGEGALDLVCELDADATALLLPKDVQAELKQKWGELGKGDCKFVLTLNASGGAFHSDELKKPGSGWAFHADELKKPGSGWAFHTDELKKPGSGWAFHADELKKPGSGWAFHTDEFNSFNQASLLTPLEKPGSVQGGVSVFFDAKKNEIVCFERKRGGVTVHEPQVLHGGIPVKSGVSKSLMVKNAGLHQKWGDKATNFKPNADGETYTFNGATYNFDAATYNLQVTGDIVRSFLENA